MKKRIYTFAVILIWVWLTPSLVHAQDQWALEDAASISSMSVSRDGSRIAVGSLAASAFLFDTEGNEQLRVDAKNSVTGVKLLDSGTLLVSSDDRHLYAFDREGKLLWDRGMKRSVKDVSASDDGKVVAVAIQRSVDVLYIDASTGEDIRTVPIGVTTQEVEVSPNGAWVVAAATDQYAHILNAEGARTGKIGAGGKIAAVAISDDGDVAIGTSGSKIELYDKEGKRIRVLSVKDDVMDVALSVDGELIAAADFSGNFYVFNREGKQLWETRGESAGRVVEFSKDSLTLYGGTDKGYVHQYDVASAVKGAEKQALVNKLIVIALCVLVVAAIAAILFAMKRKKKLGVFVKVWRSKYIYLCLLPAFGLLIVFLYVPAMSGLYHSLYDWNPGGRSVFIGLDNFNRIFHDPYVTKGIGNLGILIVTGLIKAILPPLIVAELIYHLKSKKMQYGFRTAFVASMVIPVVAMLLIWQNLYDPNVGLVNNLLELLGLGSWTHGWLGDPKTALWAIIFIGFPFVGILQLLVLYSGLLSIPNELIEAAKMDGAKLSRIIRSIHLPLLSGQFKFLIILSLIGIIQDFNAILIITGGGPMDSTYVPALQMYYAATKFDDLGYASALGVMMFLVILAITIVNMKVLKTNED
ncbi:ABC transporter permease subunit [Cohnella herbarum]|uniref:ABC transporter permease subunit n=1 Tax=Cohnella herbarum TaxID=2728023 RepID=A0A7Z2VK84_9BACL|nr:ABC transporter permease subunit [Cohnella herbarum]QJD84541.1 ABC transporter permease subunit [Cohnella herbarum]